MEKQENIIATYQQIIQETEQQLQKARKRIRYISLLRLILFVEAVASAIIFWSDGWLKLIVFTVIPIIAFIWLVQSHNRWFYWKDYLKKKIEINQQELRALQYDFSDFDNGKEYIDPSHLYTFDLDIFGEHSLFQYINRTSTPIGKQRLANWFNAHLEEKEAIETIVAAEYFFVKAERRYFKVNFSDILFIEGLKDYVILQLNDQRIITRMSLKAIFDLLPKSIFLRVNKSYIVNTDHIESFDNNDIFIKSYEIAIGNSYRDDFFEGFVMKQRL